MQKLLILSGLPASGKTTYAKMLLDKVGSNWKRVNKDDLRSMIDNGRWSKQNEKKILGVRDLLIGYFLDSGYDVISDDTNFAHIESLTEKFRSQAEVDTKFFPTDVEECIARDSKREKPVGPKVISDMYERYLKPVVRYQDYSDKLPNAIICDVDGTLAKMSGRSPFDWVRVGEDSVNEQVASILQRFSMTHKIIIVSGRDGSCEEETINWLNDKKIVYTDLFMRPAGNNEKDSIIKKRIYDEHIKGAYNVSFVLDDRDQVVRMWREQGLQCFQVAEGNF